VEASNVRIEAWHELWELYELIFADLASWKDNFRPMRIPGDDLGQLSPMDPSEA
jgi:hypothetical protein